MDSTGRLVLRLARHTFDPRDEEPELPDELRLKPPTDEAGPVIVQVHKPLTKEEQERLRREYGLRLVDYLPELAYLEILDGRAVARLREAELVRATVPYHPGFKIAPLVGERVFRSEERRRLDGLWLNVVLFDHAQAEAVASAIERLEGVRDLLVIDDRPIGGKLQLRCVAASLEVVTEIAGLPEVRIVDEVPEPNMDNVNAAGTLQSGTPGTQSIWNQGLHGEDQVIGVLDSGPIDINHCFFQDPVNNTPSTSHRKVLQVRNASSDTVSAHATFVAGCAAGDDLNLPGTGNSRGGAWAARLVSGTTADLAAGSVLAELTAAAAMGATIHTNSWHDDDHGAGNPAPYNQTAADVDTFTWNNEDHLVLGSAGNTGEEQGAPGTAKNAICVGAAQADPNEMNLGDGNPGPTADNRRKPDLVTPGCNITSSTSGTTCGTNNGGCATSWATPHTAAAAALVRQYFCEGYYPTGAQEPHHGFTPSGALLKAALVNGTLDMTGVAGYPSNMEGWGLTRLDDLLHFPGSALDMRVWDYRNADGLTTGETHVHHVDVATNAQRLKVTLAWTDPPGAANAATPIVNDLDLEVVSPGGGQTFRGNVFTGGVSSTGGTADATNNVETVLVNAPAPGDWTIRVIGTAVNVGNPGQGYGLVVTADLTEPPVTTGVQDTLVVRVKFSDIAGNISLANLQSTMVDVADYIDEVSYGGATVVPMYRGAIDLDQERAYYYHPNRNLLIELTEEVVAKLVTAEPNLFDTIERMIIVTNDVNFTGDWATTGTWPYQLPAGFTRPISVSVQGHANSVARFTHGLLHQFGLWDLYAHEGVVFPRPYVDDWDNMGGTFNNVHPLVWSKQRAGWLTAHGDTIEYIPRPAAGASYSGLNPIPLFRTTSPNANRKAIAIGLSEGASSLASENAFYFVEARRNTADDHESALPGSGVLIYYVNEMVAQGEGPVILRDKNLVTQTVEDAFYSVGDVVTIPGAGITIRVLNGAGTAPFDIQVDYTAPVTDYNVSIVRGDTINGQFYSWFSPDIWIDSPKNGFNLGAGPPPHDQRESPVTGVVNRLYARFRNTGPATAFDFDVRFRISEPYHTVGGEADFDTFVGIRHVTSLGNSEAIEFVEWTPVTGQQPHVCLKVDLINLVGTDTNEHDNWAQENLETVTSITASPFHPVTYRYNLTNPYPQASLFYFRAEGVPDGWTVDLVPRKIRLNSGERMVGEATIKPPEEAEVCTSEWIAVTSWAPRGDTLINVGGGVVQVDLRRSTVIKMDARVGRCDGRDLEILMQQMKEAGEEVDPETLRKDCGRITASGCLEPPQAGVEVILRFVDPLGNVTYRTVVTDANGCFEDFMVSATPGTWQVDAEYPGDKCEGPDRTRPVTVCWCRD